MVEFKPIPLSLSDLFATSEEGTPLFHPLIYMAVWVSISCCMILMNKAILTSWHFRYPIFLTMWHMFFGTLLTQVLCRKYPAMFKSVVEGRVTKEVVVRKIVPIAFFFSLSLIFSNTAYIYLSVSFIQMIKAFTPVNVLLLSYMLKLESNPSAMQMGIVFMICFGVAMSSIGELNFNMVGFIYQILGGFCESGRLVLSDRFLKDLKLDSLSTLYFTAPVCFCFLFISFMTVEYSTFDRSVLTFGFLIVLVLNGLLAFSLNIAIVLLITNTSALVLTLTGLFKDIMLVLFSVVVFFTPITTIQVFGYSISLYGMNLYKEYKTDPAIVQAKLVWLLAAVGAVPKVAIVSSPDTELLINLNEARGEAIGSSSSSMEKGSIN